MKKLFAKKIGMTQISLDDGVVVPVTVLKHLPTQIIGLKTLAKHGYNAVQVAFVETKKDKMNKPKLGILKNINDKFYKFIKEIRFNKLSDEAKVGSYIGLDSFTENELVNVRGKSIGKGFQGTVKRWGFGRGPMSHGSKSHRLPGSIGGHTEPGRVFKGKKMSGRMGGDNVVVKNLKIVKLDIDNNIILIKGAVPGCDKGIVEIIGKQEDLKYIFTDQNLQTTNETISKEETVNEIEVESLAEENILTVEEKKIEENEIVSPN